MRVASGSGGVFVALYMLIMFAIANGCCENCNWRCCMSTASPIFHQVHNYDAKESMLPASPSENSAYIVTGRGAGSNVETLAARASAVATVLQVLRADRIVDFADGITTVLTASFQAVATAATRTFNGYGTRLNQHNLNLQNKNKNARIDRCITSHLRHNVKIMIFCSRLVDAQRTFVQPFFIAFTR